MKNHTKQILFYPVSWKVAIPAWGACFLAGFVGGKLWLDRQRRQYQFELVKLYDEQKSETPDDEVLDYGHVIDLDDEDIPEGTVAVLQPVQHWLQGAPDEAEYIDQATLDMMIFIRDDSDEDIVVPHSMLCEEGIHSCDLHVQDHEVLEKYGRPSHGRKARKERERALGLGIFESPEVTFDAVMEEADAHAKCYYLQREGQGSSTCLVDGENPHACPHYHEWDVTAP